MRVIKIWSAATLFAGMLLPQAGLRAETPQLVTQSYTIPAADPGINLFIREKHVAGVESFAPEKILLFVHGATYPSETSFDLPIEGASMMDLVARRGYDVFLVDVRGYGGSTRPPEMSQPAAENKPVVRTDDAVRDLGAAVDHILQKRGVKRLALMGWSWGTSIAGTYASTHNDKLDRLVLYAPMWIFRKDQGIAPVSPTQTQQAAPPPALGAYRLVSRDSARERWLRGVPEDKKATLIGPGVFDAWADATWATDPDANKQNPPMLRASNGVIADVQATYAVGKTPYDPASITVPTLLLHAEWDADLPSYQAQGYFAALKNTPWKRFVEIGEGTHTVMLEKNRMQFFRELITFLDEPAAPGE
jgi:pimeloyl-ACP methyl ester carboxylesterase